MDSWHWAARWRGWRGVPESSACFTTGCPASTDPPSNRIPPPSLRQWIQNQPKPLLPAQPQPQEPPISPQRQHRQRHPQGRHPARSMPAGRSAPQQWTCPWAAPRGRDRRVPRPARWCAGVALGDGLDGSANGRWGMANRSRLSSGWRMYAQCEALWRAKISWWLNTKTANQ